MTADELLLTAIRKCRRVDLYADPRPLTPDEQKTYDALRARYQSGEPLQYLLGEADSGRKLRGLLDVLRRHQQRRTNRH